MIKKILIEENGNIIELQPFVVRVEDPDNVGVSFSIFSVAKNKYLDPRIKRGVANITIGGNQTNKVILYIYAKVGETKVYAFKDPDRVDMNGKILPSNNPDWDSIIMAEFPGGDPSIALGE